MFRDLKQKYMRIGFWIYAISYVFKGMVKFVCSYYYAINKTTVSNLLICLDAIVLAPLTLFLLPKLGLGINGIWLSLPVSQMVVSAVATLWLYYSAKKKTL